MALSNLTSLTEKQFNALNITPFPKSPGVSKTGNPDDKVNIQPAGWVGNDVIAFKITNDIQNSSTASIDRTATDVIDVDVVAALNPTETTTFWTVEMGTGNDKGNDWTLTYEVERNSAKTGKWVFTKGKDTFD